MKTHNHSVLTRIVWAFTIVTFHAVSMMARAQVVTAVYNSIDDVPVTTNGYNTTSQIVSFTLNFVPPTGAELMVIKNTGLDFIHGTFGNLAQGQLVNLNCGGINYPFVADYFGGNGNDLVLVWAKNRVFAWGDDYAGKIGDGSYQVNKFVPVPVVSTGSLSGKTIIALAAGYDHSLALASDGSVMSWGMNVYGQLGDGTTVERHEPVLALAVSGNKRVVAIAAGLYHSLALCSDGTIAAWGYNSSGQLGDTTRTTRNAPVAVNAASGISDLFGRKVVAIAAGNRHSLALCQDGALVAWGANGAGQLGDNSNDFDRAVPKLVNAEDGISALAGKTVTAVSAGFEHTVALCSDGSVAAWGRNADGQLGNGTTNISRVPNAVSAVSGTALFGKTVTAISAGRLHTLALCSDNTIASWGDNFYGALGDNSQLDRTSPVNVNKVSGVSALFGREVLTISGKRDHSLVLCADGEVAGWGQTNDGQLGINSSGTRQVPVLTFRTTLNPGERFTRILTGCVSSHSMAVVSSPLSIASVTLSNLVHIFDGTPKSATAKTDPPGLTVVLTYNGSSAPPTNVGVYTVIGTVVHPEYQGRATNTMHIGVQTVDAIFNAATDVPVIASNYVATGKTLNLGLNFLPGPLGGTELMVVENTGSEFINGTFNNLAQGEVVTLNYAGINYQFTANYFGGSGNDLVLIAAPVTLGTVTLGNLNQTYNGSARSVTATTSPPGLAVAITYNGSPNPPTNGGTYTVIGQINDPVYQGIATNVLTIFKVVTNIVLGSLSQIYDGTPRMASATTTPAGLNVNFTYNGSSNAPTKIGSYLVVGTIVSDNYQGSETGTLIVGRPTATVTLSNLVQSYNGSARIVTASTVPPNLTVNLTYKGSPNAPTNVGTYAVVGTIGDAVYQGNATGLLMVGTTLINAIYNSATDVPVSSDEFVATGKAVNFTLNFAPATGTELFVVKNSGLGFISGTFEGLTNGQPVTLSYQGISYSFVANYFGGSGNDLVLVWAKNRVFAWGNNRGPNIYTGDNSGDFWGGQIGDGTTGVNRLVPVPVIATGVLAGKTIVAVSAGYTHSLALCSDGTLAAWGLNSEGEVGDGTWQQRLAPVAVSTTGGSALAGKRVVAIAAGYYFSLALCSDGTVASWGWSSHGQLGDGSGYSSRSLPVAVITNAANSTLAGKTVVAISAGADHSMALCSDGTVASWGSDANGMLGDNATGIDRPTPVAVNTASGVSVLFGRKVIAISAGAFESMALCSDGTVATWGYNGYGQLGDGTTTSRQSPVAVNASSGVSALFNKTVVAIVAGNTTSRAVCSDGVVAGWGNNYAGALGDNSATNRKFPVEVNRTSGLSALFGKTVVGIGAGGGHGLALCTDGTAAAWGYNSQGQLGNNSTGSRTVPVAVNTAPLAAGERFIRLASGQTSLHTLAVVAVQVRIATVTLSNLNQAYDGTAKNVTAVTTPPGLAVDLTYNGSPSAPTNVGSYVVIARVNDVEYQGSTTDILRIGIAPFITVQPMPQKVTVGSNATFSVMADGTAPLSYQWIRNGVSLGAGATNSVYSFVVPAQPGGSYSVRVTNLFGSVFSSNALLTVNHVPSVSDATFSISEDQFMIPGIILPAFDQDGDALSYFIVSPPIHGSLTNVQGGAFYRPATNFYGSDSFTFKVSDGMVDSAVATVNITVTPVNDRPMAQSQSVSLDKNTSTSIVLAASDVEDDPLTYNVAQPEHGTLTGVAPNLTYQPVTNYYGPDSFTFTTNDGKTNSEVATINITVRRANRAPVADATATTTLLIVSPNCSPRVILDGSCSTDPDGDSLQYVWYRAGETNALATGFMAVVTVPLGTNLVILVVDDGLATNTQSVTVELVTTAQAVERLMALVDSQAEKPKPLMATLLAALACIERGNLTTSVNELRAFQNKVAAQVQLNNPALAGRFTQAAEAVIEALLRDCAAANPHGHVTRLNRNANGKVQVGIIAPAGAAYLVQASTDLVTWETIGVAVSTTTGEVEFEDSDADKVTARFYRFVFP